MKRTLFPALKSKIFVNLGRSSTRRKSYKSASQRNRRSRNLQLEGLESREMFSVSSLWFNGSTLVIQADDASTSVTVSQVDSSIRINDVSTNRRWNYAASSVGSVEFRGGAGNDRFVNNVGNLSVRCLGRAGNDYLQGHNGNDTLYGGDGHDTLVGYGGNDRMGGEAGNDILRGMAGNDRITGDDGNDYMDGGDGVDMVSGGRDHDVLLGGNGNDHLSDNHGNDRLNGQAGIDYMSAGPGEDVVISIDAAFGEYVSGGGDRDILWIDRVGSNQDKVEGETPIDLVLGVASFANGADRTLNGDNLADPTDSGNKLRFNNVISAGNTLGTNPLFSHNSVSGPKMTDVTQGDVGDCWLLAGLGAIALDSPHALRQNVVDFDDGTYGVRLGNNFYRVDNEMPVWNTAAGATSNNLRYAQLGAQNSMWVAVVEKAFAHYRTGANSYASLDYGWTIEVNRAFRSANAGEMDIISYSSATDLVNVMYNLYCGYQAVTIGFFSISGSVPLRANHAYTVAGFNLGASGNIVSVLLRNPWGFDGAGSDGSDDGFVTLTPAQLFAQKTGMFAWGAV
jgi:Ca2+-binding RTX toxin-like protein